MLETLMEKMRQFDTDWLIVFSCDAHLSEYTSKCDRFIPLITHFTGSAATLLVSEGEALLWTDSRYYVQATDQLKGTGITLMKAGMPSVPSVEKYLSEHVWDGQKVSADLKTVSFEYYKRLVKTLPASVEITDGADVIKALFTDMPKREFKDIAFVPESYSGKSTEDKLDSLRSKIRKRYVSEDSYTYIVSDLPSIMWLFNLRGDDIDCVPVAYSYAMITQYGAVLYLRRDKLCDEAGDSLDSAGVAIKEYSCFYDDLEDIATDVILSDPYGNNAKILCKADEKGILEECSDPVLIPKAYKNDAEIRGMKESHIKDAVTMIRFIKAVKEMAGSDSLPDEYELGKMLDAMRLEGGAEATSFKTICAYKENASVVHYIAKKDTAKKIGTDGFLLVDSGGHYRFEGTTDITRTISLGKPTEEERKVYTTVLKGNLRLMDAIFPEGFKGSLLDGIAESPLWDAGYFCGHGIGHGVGCYLSVHESEARISRNEGSREVAFFPGLIVSDEPGVYIEGKFGVRLENLLLVENAGLIDGHKMCGFRTLTLVPFDRESVDMNLMSDKEKEILLKYNRSILEIIGPKLDEETLSWLKENIDIK